MDPIVNEVAKSYKGQVDFVYIDTTTASGKKKSSEQGIRGVPTFLFFDSDGERVRELVGKKSRDTLERALDHLLGQ